MRPLDRLSEYLIAVERRLRLLAVTRGIAATAAAALIFTVVAVLWANHFAFSNLSVVSGRVLLFLGIAFAIAAALVLPVIRLNRRRAAKEAESRLAPPTSAPSISSSAIKFLTLSGFTLPP